MELTPGQAADAVERHDCPQCQVPAGSPCRTRGRKTAVKYHTARFVLVPALREELEVPVPGDRGPSRAWEPGRPAGPPAAAQHGARPLRVRSARPSTPRQELTSQPAPPHPAPSN